MLVLWQRWQPVLPSQFKSNIGHKHIRDECVALLRWFCRPQSPRLLVPVSCSLLHRIVSKRVMSSSNIEYRYIYIYIQYYAAANYGRILSVVDFDYRFAETAAESSLCGYHCHWTWLLNWKRIHESTNNYLFESCDWMKQNKSKESPQRTVGNKCQSVKSRNDWTQILGTNS